MNRRKLAELGRELSRREAMKRQRKEDQERKKVEKLLKNIRPEDLGKAFPDLEERIIINASDTLSDRIVGRNMCHLWQEDHDGVSTMTMYYGKVEKMKKNKKDYVVAYWLPKESHDDAEDYTMNKYQLAADIICGELLLS